MTKTTAGRLNPVKMAEIKDLILAKFRPNRCQADKEELWKRRKAAIGQSVNYFAQRQFNTNVRHALTYVYHIHVHAFTHYA